MIGRGVTIAACAVVLVVAVYYAGGRDLLEVLGRR